MLRFLAATLLTGCAMQLPMPMTAEDLVRYPSGEALVAYLGQPDASANVCDLRAQGPHVVRVDDEVHKALVAGLVEAKIEPALWRRCVDAMLASGNAEQAAALIDASGRGYRKLITDDEFEKLPALQARLAALQKLYLERRNGLDGHPDVLGPMFADLRKALAKAKLGPLATRAGEELIAAVDLEQGRFRGRAVDAAAIDELADETWLRRFAVRLPQPELREHARRRVIRIQIARSPFLEVREHAAAIEEAVLKYGVNRVDIGQHVALKGWLDPQKTPMRGVLVRQNVWAQTATLLGYAGDRPGVSVLPEISLRDALMVQVRGLSRPVTLCAPAEALDPTPCIAASDVTLENAPAFLDEDGAFHFVDHISMHDAIALAQEGERLTLPVRVGGRPLLSLEWALYYERPENLVFGGQSAGARGPDLSVGIDHRDRQRFFLSVFTPGRRVQAVVEARDMPGFVIASEGAAGFTGHAGAQGTNGTDGTSGMSASCPGSPGGNGTNGTDGGPGGPGGPGGRGGDGGNVSVELACGDEPCDEARELLAQTIVSLAGAGGAGGPGGAGGHGGRGGAGGSGTTCTDSNGNTTSVSGGTSGSNGSDGARGADGQPGPPGRAGQVHFKLVR